MKSNNGVAVAIVIYIVYPQSFARGFSVFINSTVVTFVPAVSEVYWIQFYVIKFFSDLRKVNQAFFGFLCQ